MRPLTVGLVLTITLIGFSSLAVETILPLVSDELGGVSLYGWVFSAFFLGSLVSVIVAGGIADQRGTLLPYSVGLSLFVLGLFIAGAAPAMAIVVSGRLVQGTGSGAILASTYASIARGYTETQRPRIFAIISTAWVLPALVGPAAFLPLMLREARGLAPTLAGLVLTTGGVSWTAGSWVHERLAPRLTSRTIITTAFALVALGACGVLAVLLTPIPWEVAYLA